MLHFPPLMIWLVAYCIPAFLAGIISALIPGKRITMIAIHVLLLFSIGIAQYFIHIMHLSFPWSSGFAPILFYVISIILSVAAIGKLGAVYAISAFIQELTMFSTAFIVLQSFSFPYVVVMIVPFFVLGHELKNPHQYLKALILSAGGIFFVWCLSHSVSLFLVAALHTLAGTVLIKTSIIYRFGLYRPSSLATR